MPAVSIRPRAIACKDEVVSRICQNRDFLWGKCWPQFAFPEIMTAVISIVFRLAKNQEHDFVEGAGPIFFAQLLANPCGMLFTGFSLFEFAVSLFSLSTLLEPLNLSIECLPFLLGSFRIHLENPRKLTMQPIPKVALFGQVYRTREGPQTLCPSLAAGSSVACLDFG